MLTSSIVLRDTADILWYLPGTGYKYLLVWIFEDGGILFLGKCPSHIVSILNNKFWNRLIFQPNTCNYSITAAAFSL